MALYAENTLCARRAFCGIGRIGADTGQMAAIIRCFWGKAAAEKVEKILKGADEKRRNVPEDQTGAGGVPETRRAEKASV